MVGTVLVYTRVHDNLHDSKNKHGHFNRGDGQYLEYSVIDSQYYMNWANERLRVLRPELVRTGPPAGRSLTRSVEAQICK